MDTKKIYLDNKKTLHDQVINFDNGSVQYLYNVTHVEESKWVHIFCDDGRGPAHVIVNPNRVLFLSIKRPTKDVRSDKEDKN